MSESDKCEDIPSILKPSEDTDEVPGPEAIDAIILKQRRIPNFQVLTFFMETSSESANTPVF